MLHHDPQPPKPLRADDDQLKAQLKKAIRRSPRRRVRLLIALGISGVVVALVAWWFWPRTPVPPLLVIAFDEVALGQRQVLLRAATEPADGSDQRWGGRELFFEEVRGLAPGASGTTKKITSDDAGLSQVAWQVPGTATHVEMEVRYLDERQRPPWSDRDHGRVFFWPADARLLIVDVELTLKPGKDGDAAATALTAASEKGWRIVYLAVIADRPLAYRKLRATPRPAPAPDGPVLGRKKYYYSAAEAEARKEVLADLKRGARGPVVYVSAEQGVNLWTVGDEGVLSGGLAVADWTALAAALPP